MKKKLYVSALLKRMRSRIQTSLFLVGKWSVYFMLFTLPCSAHQVDQDTNQFALQLYTELTKEKTPNILFSPYSIFSSLSLLYAGAKGKTASEIANVLHITGTPNSLFNQNRDWIKRLITPPRSKGYKLLMANALFVNSNDDVSREFQQIAIRDFNAYVTNVDFAKPEEALKTVNEWFASQTNGNISDLLQKSDIDALTRLVMTSAIYFEGSWVLPFNKDLTALLPFYVTAEQTPSVATMRQKAYFSYFETDLAQGIWLPIELGQNTQAAPACVILLPRDEESLSTLEMSFDTDVVSHWMTLSKQRYIDLELPKFCVSQSLLLNAILQKMGMQLPFTNQADFSGINGKKDLRLSRVLHGAYFSLNEQGISAAAGTAGSLGVKSTPNQEEPFPLKINRPFLFFIIDQNAESILFMGKISQPNFTICP